MKTPHEKRGRRSALKSLAVTSTVIATQVLPESWQKPVINSIVLPSHAQTTEATDSSAVAEDSPPPPPVNPCTGDSITIDSNNFAAVVVYDTLSPATLVLRKTPFSRPGVPDAILSAGPRSFAIAPFGDNWERSDPIQETNVADGLYTRSTRRMVNGKPSGERYEITFCIATSGADESRQMTLTLVSINKI